MGVIHKLIKFFSNFRGLDERTSNISEASEYASEVMNVKFRKDGGISKRNGYQSITTPLGEIGGKGNYFYYESDKDTGAVSETLLSATSNLYRLREYSFDVTYSYSNTLWKSYYSIKAAEGDTLSFQISEETDIGTINTYTYNLGHGYETVTTPVGLAAFKKWIQNASGTEVGAPPTGRFSVGILGSEISYTDDSGAEITSELDDNHPAACLEKTDGVEMLNGVPVPIKYYKWEIIPSGNGEDVPFEEAYELATREDSENYSFTNLNEIMYISTGFDSIKKYDGNRVYTAGMATGGDTLSSGYVSGGFGSIRKAGALKLTHKDQFWLYSPSSNGNVYEHTYPGESKYDVPDTYLRKRLKYSQRFHAASVGSLSENLPWFVKDTPKLQIIANTSGGSVTSYTVRVRVRREVWTYKERSYPNGELPATYSKEQSTFWEPYWRNGVFIPREMDIKAYDKEIFTSTHFTVTPGTTTVGQLQSFIQTAAHDPAQAGAMPFDKWVHSDPSYPNDSNYPKWTTDKQHILYEPHAKHFRRASEGDKFRWWSPIAEDHSVEDDPVWLAIRNAWVAQGYGTPYPDFSSIGVREKRPFETVDLEGTLAATDVITELAISSDGFEIQNGKTLHASQAGETQIPLNISVSAETVGTGNIPVGETGPFYPKGDLEYCTEWQDNGEPYPDKTSCESAGGAWVNTAEGKCIEDSTGVDKSETATGGTCSISAYTTKSTCEGANPPGIWTPNEDTCIATTGQTWFPNRDEYNEWRWKVTYMHKDKKRNSVVGNPGKSFNLTLTRGDKARYTPLTMSDTNDTVSQPNLSLTRVGKRGLESVSISIPTVKNRDGFSTASGIVNGAQSFDNDPTGTCTSPSSAITADTCTGTFTLSNNNNISSDYLATINLSEHSFIVGDTAYFKDTYHTTQLGRDTYREFEITAVTSTSITVKVNKYEDDLIELTDENKYWFSLEDKAVISNNLRLQIWRTKNLGHYFIGEPVYHLVEELPHTLLKGNTIFYTDTKKDDDLGPVLEDLVPLPHINRIFPIPKGKYLTAVSNTLAIAGSPQSVGTVYRMEPGHPEIYSGLGSFYTVDADGGGAITGLGVLNKMLYVFQDRAINVVGGNLATGQVRIDVISTPNMGIGCESHHTIKEVKGELFFLSEKGVYSLVPGTPPKEVSARVAPQFNTGEYNNKKAISLNWNENDLYILCMPPKSTSVLGAKVLVFDSFRDAWTNWENFDISRGAAVGTEDIYFTEATFQSLCKLRSTKSESDYADHHKPISLKYKTNWEALGDATQLKRFIRLKAFATDSSGTFETDKFIVDVNTELNYDTTIVGKIAFDFGKWSGGWGDTPYGKIWGDDIIQNKFLKSKLSGKKTTAIRVTFLNSELNKNTLISGYEFEVAAPYRPEIKH